MKTLLCTTPGQLDMIEAPMPTPTDGEVLLRVRRVGICGTDMHIYRGTQPYLSYPRIMGHEIAGEVVSAPPHSKVHAGDTVYVMPYLSCGECGACRKGKSNCCTRLQVLGVHRDGGMCEYLTIPAEFAFKVDGLSLDETAMLEFLAVGMHAVRRAGIATGQLALVVGAGPIGMAVALFARLRGAQLTVMDTRADRLEFCRQSLGIPCTVLVGEGDREQLSDLSGGAFFDTVFDATGNVRAMERGLDFVAHGGTYVLVSIVRDRISFADPEFHKRETTLLGSRNATVEDFQEVVAAIKAGLVPTGALNTHRASMPELVTALPDWMQESAGVIKAIVEV